MMVIADNIQIVNPIVQRALADHNPDPLTHLVDRCVSAGADALDVNPGPLGRNAGEKMAFLVDTIQATTDLPLVIDTANPVAMAAGLKASRVVPMINGFSLEPHKLSGFLPLALEYDADIVGYLLHPDGRVPSGTDDRLEIALALYHAFKEAGGNPDRLVIDPIVVPVSWQDGHFQAARILEVIRILPDLLDFPVRTIAGLSNLTSGQRDADKKQTVEAAFLPMLAAAGLDMILLNIMRTGTLRAARAARMILGNGVFAWEDL